MLLRIATFAALVLAGSATKAETIFDFETLDVGNFSSISQTKDGITLTITGPSAFDVTPTGYGDFGARSIITFNNLAAAPYIGNFSQAVSNVTISAGDFGSDTDSVSIELWSDQFANGTLLGSALVGPCCDGFIFSSISASVTASGVRSIKFFTGPNDLFPGSLFFDNIRVNGAPPPPAVIPEPASWAMMIIGFGAVGRSLRSRHINRPAATSS